jgi:glycosyltransferase involved in cell wall biosynthesis
VKVLISAYACEPNKGSEPGAGWNWSLAAARNYEVWVLTRSNNRSAIEAELVVHPCRNVHFVYLDLPPWACRWKRGQRGVRLYYSLWQAAAYREAKRLHERIGFDVVHHLTFANAWLPAGVAFIDAPFVLGPADAGLSVPVCFYRELGVRGILLEWKAETARMLGRANPLVRHGVRRARVVLAQNGESADRLRRLNRAVSVRPNASADIERLRSAVVDAEPRREREALVAGRLVPLKGVSLAIRAIALLSDWSLTIVGTGPEESRLRGLAATLGVSDRVTFVPWLAQEDLWKRMRESTVVVVPSFREAASFVTAEAVTLGTPVVALDQGGPRSLSHGADGAITTVALGSTCATAWCLAEAIRESPCRRRLPTVALSSCSIVDDLRAIYEDAVSSKLQVGLKTGLKTQAARLGRPPRRELVGRR